MATLGGSGLAARAAQAVHRRRQVHWTSPGRSRVDAYLSVAKVGSGNQPILLLHSLAVGGGYFGSEFDELGQPGPLLVPDLLGFGESPPSPAGYGVEAQVDALGRCLEATEVLGRLLVVGYSVGASIALRMAVRHPSRVRAVVAISPPLFEDPEVARKRAQQLVTLELGGSLDRGLARSGRRVPALAGAVIGGAGRLARLDLPAPLADGSRQPELSVRRELLDSAVLQTDQGVWLDEISCPVHLVLPAHDPVPDSSVLAGLAEHCANVSLEVLPFGDHRLPLTHPGGCLAAIDRFRALRGAGQAAE